MFCVASFVLHTLRYLGIFRSSPQDIRRKEKDGGVSFYSDPGLSVNV